MLVVGEKIIGLGCVYMDQPTNPKKNNPSMMHGRGKMGAAPTSTWWCYCLHVDAASEFFFLQIRAEPGLFGQNQVVSAISDRIGWQLKRPKSFGCE